MKNSNKVLLIVSLSINIVLLITTTIFATLLFTNGGKQKSIDGQMVESVTTELPQFEAKVDTEYLNVRKEPSAYSTKLGILTYGETVEVYQKDDETGWAKIKYQGEVAYCSSEFLKIIGVSKNTYTPLDIKDSEIQIEMDAESGSFDDGVYSLSEMNAAQIVEEFIYYFNDFPYEGQTYEEYETTMKVRPNNPKSESLSYTFGDGILREPKEDCILSISMGGTTMQMDGSIGLKKAQSADGITYFESRVSAYICDYEKANAVFELLYEYFLSQYPTLTKETENTDWYCYTDLKTSSFSSREIIPLRMGKAQNGYYIDTECYTER